MALNNYFLLLNKEKSKNCTVKLTAETLFQYATVPTPKYHLLISDQITSHYCVVRLLINAFQPDQLPTHLCQMQFRPFPPRCKPVTARGGANLNAMFVPFIFLFSRFLYKSINKQ